MNGLRRQTCVFLLAVMLPLAAFGQSLEQAAQDAARRYDAKVLSAHTEQRGARKVHVIKLLTRKGVVKVVRVTVRQNKGR
ncbi:hypothetical protein [Elongatibacter sediminis]|uniref:PepSY domain-containing protein n=1 Tax=Elongatibacter sediminis TaxID=3119006 RepID=A0AAW9RAE4_9GAMM